MRHTDATFVLISEFIYALAYRSRKRCFQHRRSDCFEVVGYKIFDFQSLPLSLDHQIAEDNNGDAGGNCRCF